MKRSSSIWSAWIRISSSRPSSSARSTTCPPKPATVVPAGIASTAKIPLPFGPADRVTASGLSQDWRTGASMVCGAGDRGLTIGAGGRGAASRNQAARQSGHNTGVGKRQEREKLARRRIASTRRADDDASTRRPPVRAGHLSPRRSVPAGIPRPPYAPDAPALLPAVPPDEIPDRMRAAGHAAREVLLAVGAAVAAGVTTDTLDRICHDAYIARGGYPSTLDYKSYPKSLCTSVNEVICHGIPDDRALQDGDIVNCDVTIYLHGVHGDCSETFLVGDVDETRAGSCRPPTSASGRASTR